MKEVDLYFGMLMGLHVAQGHLRDVLREHADCDGCNLCIDATGMEYTIKLYLEMVASDAPAEAIGRFDREIAPDDELADEIAQALAARPATPEKNEPASPGNAPELPTQRTTPYWLQ